MIREGLIYIYLYIYGACLSQWLSIFVSSQQQTILASNDFFYQQPPPGFDEVNAVFGDVVGACGDIVDRTHTHTPFVGQLSKAHQRLI